MSEGTPVHYPSFRDRLASQHVVRLMSAHNPLSARIAMETGFDGIWASGFEMSAAACLADVSLLTMTQHLDVTRAMVARTGAPVLADLDTGFGNAVNVDYAVREYAMAGAAGIVIEDKVFPKVTSLVAGGRQELLRLEEFQGKIAAAKHAARAHDTLIFGRTEALIADAGEGEALRRAAAYEEAGADVIFVHSKSNTPDQIMSFARKWQGKAPLAVVPTSYPSFGPVHLAEAPAIRVVIYGNHTIRSAIAGMKAALARILADGHSLGVEEDIASVTEVFRLQGMDHVREIENTYLK